MMQIAKTLASLEQQYKGNFGQLRLQTHLNAIKINSHIEEFRLDCFRNLIGKFFRFILKRYNALGDGKRYKGTLDGNIYANGKGLHETRGC